MLTNFVVTHFAGAFFFNLRGASSGVITTGGAFANWSGIAPDGTPLLVRDASIQEIYALDWDAP